MSWTPPTSSSKDPSTGIDSAWMGVNNNGRQAMGTSVVSHFVDCSAMYTSAHIVGHKRAKGGPTAKTAGGRTHTTEHLGPSYVVKATRPAQSQESQTTMGNTRWVKGSGW